MDWQARRWLSALGFVIVLLNFLRSVTSSQPATRFSRCTSSFWV